MTIAEYIGLALLVAVVLLIALVAFRRVSLTRANQARQAQITQELTEIIGGADALAAANSEED